MSAWLARAVSSLSPNLGEHNAALPKKGRERRHLPSLKPRRVQRRKWAPALERDPAARQISR